MFNRKSEDDSPDPDPDPAPLTTSLTDSLLGLYLPVFSESQLAFELVLG